MRANLGFCRTRPRGKIYAISSWGGWMMQRISGPWSIGLIFWELGVLSVVGAPVGACGFDPTVSIQTGHDGAGGDVSRWDAQAIPDGSFQDRGLDAGDAAVVDAGPSCHGTCEPCASLGQEDCRHARGCGWETDHCEGTCVPCSQKTDEESCVSQTPCSWTQVGSQCEGTCSACSSFGDETACRSQEGCSWSLGDCQGTPSPCEGRDVFTCQDGCTWHSGKCSGGTVDCSQITEAGDCVFLGCHWSLRAEVCWGNGPACSSLNGSLSCAASEHQCRWQPGSCGGTPDACHTVSSSTYSEEDGCT